jgi:hypothetical protein
MMDIGDPILQKILFLNQQRATALMTDAFRTREFYVILDGPTIPCKDGAKVLGHIEHCIALCADNVSARMIYEKVHHHLVG